MSFVGGHNHRGEESRQSQSQSANYYQALSNNNKNDDDKTQVVPILELGSIKRQQTDPNQHTYRQKNDTGAKTSTRRKTEDGSQNVSKSNNSVVNTKENIANDANPPGSNSRNNRDRFNL